MRQSLPTWALAAAAVVGIALVVLGWRSISEHAGAPSVGRDIPVRPGMYDMRAEMQKGRGSQ